MLRRMRLAASLLAVAALLAACGGGSDLAERDPKGAEACQQLGEAFENRDDAERAIAGSMRAGAAAEQAETESIRNATIDLGGEVAADPEAMVEACRGEGVDMPDVPNN
jgi:ABC-type phosphate/phosphonate transport system substrate-binding protein